MATSDHFARGGCSNFRGRQFDRFCSRLQRCEEKSSTWNREDANARDTFPFLRLTTTRSKQAAASGVSGKAFQSTERPNGHLSFLRRSPSWPYSFSDGAHRIHVTLSIDRTEHAHITSQRSKGASSVFPRGSHPCVSRNEVHVFLSRFLVPSPRLELDQRRRKTFLGTTTEVTLTINEKLSTREGRKGGLRSVAT